MSLTQVKTSNIDDTGSGLNFRNRIINGAMTIDQRNAGGSVTQTAGVTYTVDRWAAYGSQTSKFTVQQNAGSVTPPTGFSNYLGVTSSSAYTVGSGEGFWIRQPIEGANIADFGWGTANAKTVTLSFWVRSSLTGAFGGAIVDNFTPLSYPFSYTIATANTWEQKTITITGPTSGTFPTGNTAGLYLIIGLGNGATLSGTAGVWTAANLQNVTGATSVVGTSGATFYITGVQLEEGNAATAFERRPYGTELALCQRYAWKYGGVGLDIYGAGTGLYADANEIVFGPVMCPVLMRGTPSMTVFGTPKIKINGGAYTGWTASIASASAQMSFVRMSKTSHGLTATVSTNLNFDSTSDYLIFAAEL